MKSLKIAETAGFCFGVQRSVELAEELLNNTVECSSYGELIHNEDVVNHLCSMGMKVVQSIEEVKTGDKVLIRAHGVAGRTLEELRASGAVITDATCPKVMAIHKIVSNASKDGRFVMIIGMRNHPEVEAIKGWCDESVIFENPDEVQKWYDEKSGLTEFIDKKITVVVQTTQTQENFKNCKELIKKLYTNVQIFDTICLATFTRQEEAKKLASNCDAMVVIGGKHSANSIHLAQICSEFCDNVQFIERAEELNTELLKEADVVGLTAGASTPSWIIKEVRNKMSDEIKVEESTAGELSFDEMLEETLKTIYNGEKVTGIVAGISNTEVSVDLGAKYSGFIPTSEFTDAGLKVEDAIKVGDEIEAIVVRVNDVEGTAQLSKKRLDAQLFWNDLENATEDGTVCEGVVTETNKGGVVVNVKGARVFVPASQTDLPREADLNELLKKNVKLKITEVNKARKRIVGSIRRAGAAERKALSEETWNSIEVGKKFMGVVKSLTSYGAFVDIGGVDGMVHVSELTWGRINKPSDVVKVGDEFEVYVINFDKEAKRISLGYKDPNANPWTMFTNRYQIGDVANVKIVKLMPFGAFAEVLPGVDGLIHISQLADRRVDKVEDVVKVGDEVEAKITAIDDEKHKVSLSIRALLNPMSEDFDEEVPAEE